jgi:hypothetical protein
MVGEEQDPFVLEFIEHEFGSGKYVTQWEILNFVEAEFEKTVTDGASPRFWITVRAKSFEPSFNRRRSSG